MFLEFLAEYGDVLASDIAKGVGIPRSAVSYRLRKMLGKGLVVVNGGAGPNDPTRIYRQA